MKYLYCFFFFSSRRRHTRCSRDWSSDVCSSDLDWAKIGVTVNIKQTTTADLLGTYRAQKGQLVMINWGPDYPDPGANVNPFTDYKAKSIAYRNGWDDATIAQ